jgi:hypothetical protein
LELKKIGDTKRSYHAGSSSCSNSFSNYGTRGSQFDGQDDGAQLMRFIVASQAGAP